FASLRLAQTLKTAVDAPRREGFSCPVCHAAPPTGPFWSCTSCGATFDPLDPAAPGVPVASETTTLNLSPRVDAVDPTDDVARGPGCQTRGTSLKCFRCGTATTIGDWKVDASLSGPTSSIVPSVTRLRRPQAPSISSLVFGVCLAIVTLMAWFVAV